MPSEWKQRNAGFMTRPAALRWGIGICVTAIIGLLLIVVVQTRQIQDTDRELTAVRDQLNTLKQQGAELS